MNVSVVKPPQNLWFTHSLVRSHSMETVHLAHHVHINQWPPIHIHLIFPPLVPSSSLHWRLRCPSTFLKCWHWLTSTTLSGNAFQVLGPLRSLVNVLPLTLNLCFSHFWKWENVAVYPIYTPHHSISWALHLRKHPGESSLHLPQPYYMFPIVTFSLTLSPFPQDQYPKPNVQINLLLNLSPIISTTDHPKLCSLLLGMCEWSWIIKAKFALWKQQNWKWGEKLLNLAMT